MLNSFFFSSRQSLAGSSRLSTITPKNKDDTTPVSRTSSQSSLVGTSRTASQSSIALPSRSPSQSSMPTPSRTLSQTSLAGVESVSKRSSFVEVPKICIFLYYYYSAYTFSFIYKCTF